ncbi:MAG: tetratricopeptide repeat protein [Gemmatimonadota bacterium]
MTPLSAQDPAVPCADLQSAEVLVAAGREFDRIGDLAAAADHYAAAMEAAGPDDPASRSEAMRRLGVIHHIRAEPVAASELCRRALAVATDARLDLPAAEALNALGGFAFEAGALDEAVRCFGSALACAADHPVLMAMAEQNLGIVQSIRGNWATAATHFTRAALSAEARGDLRGVAFAYHNLGLMSVEQCRWDEAAQHFRRAMDTALILVDTHLEGLCLLNQAQLHVAHERWDDARQNAERALRIFERLDARRDRADATRVLGIVFRETSRPALAESRLHSAIEMAAAAACPLAEARARRELAALHWQGDRRTEAVTELALAAELFARVGAVNDARRAMVRLQELQAA